MNNECEYTRSRLSRYQSGHLFKLQQLRIERHLADCPVCRSEFDALNRIRETQRFLVDLDGAGGVHGKVRSAASVGSRLIFRPLWVVLIVISMIMGYRYVVSPILHDPDLEQLDTGSVAPVPAPPQPVATAVPTPTPAATPAPPVRQAGTEQPKESAPASNPLVVTISVEKEREKESLKQVNEAMKEHALLKTMRFSDKVREVAGNLTADELYTFFNRIQGSARVVYKRSRLTSLTKGELVPVVLKLQTHAAPSRKEPEQQPAKPVEKPVQKPVETPVDAPVGKPLKTVDEQAGAPVQPAR